jgi:hypothetical protein
MMAYLGGYYIKNISFSALPLKALMTRESRHEIYMDPMPSLTLILLFSVSMIMFLYLFVMYICQAASTTAKIEDIMDCLLREQVHGNIKSRDTKVSRFDYS